MCVCEEFFVLRRIEDILLLIWYFCCVFMNDMVPFLMEVVQRVVLTAFDNN